MRDRCPGARLRERLLPIFWRNVHKRDPDVCNHITGCAIIQVRGEPDTPALNVVLTNFLESNPASSQNPIGLPGGVFT